MKKKAIKTAVERAKEEYLPAAIAEEAQRVARDEVLRALYPPPKPAPEKPRDIVIDPHDPRLCGNQ